MVKEPDDRKLVSQPDDPGVGPVLRIPEEHALPLLPHVRGSGVGGGLMPGPLPKQCRMWRSPHHSPARSPESEPSDHPVEGVARIRPRPSLAAARPLVIGVSLLLMSLIGVGSATRATGPAARNNFTSRPNVVLIVTDDQRWDSLWAMPTLATRVAAAGVTFSNAFAVTPVCCASRASILTGRYSHSTGVYRNFPPNGGFPSFQDAATLATALESAGYRSGLVGKYLNAYTIEDAAYVPPGWDRWVALTTPPDYYDYSISLDGVAKSYGDLPADYSTDVLASFATAFVRNTAEVKPLFLYFAPFAPHEPATPAPRHADAFTDLRRWRPPSYNELDASDKPAYIRGLPTLTRTERLALDAFRRDQYRSLLAVDEAIGQILDALEETGRLSNTLLVFTSDNGYLWGEHRWRSKFVPYNESIRVPMILRYDPMIEAPRVESRLALNIDLAPTILAAADASLPGVEGRDMLPLLGSSPPPWRKDFLVEHVEEAGAPTYCGVRNTPFSYVRYATGEEELYDLKDDRYELTNVVADPAYQSVLEGKRSRLAVLCLPPPPGFEGATGRR
ncbi:hypothetical protein BH20ACT24_BH20ACT24_16250 [soil metagenome]